VEPVHQGPQERRKKSPREVPGIREAETLLDPEARKRRPGEVEATVQEGEGAIEAAQGVNETAKKGKPVTRGHQNRGIHPDIQDPSQLGARGSRITPLLEYLKAPGGEECSPSATIQGGQIPPTKGA
jgi:hypothetical protein